MAQVTAVDLRRARDPEEFMRFASYLLNDVVTQINGQLEFQKNIKGQLVTGIKFPSTPATDVEIRHTLGRIPQGWIITSLDGASIIYKGSAVFTVKSIFLKSSVASVTVSLFLF